jgi:hypothetical protein
MKYNDFKTDLQYSLSQRECDLFDSFYYRVFPNLANIEFVEDMERQRKGIDKVLHFQSGYKVTIDEKKRRKDYGDILLEIWSVHESKKRGWLYYSECDYIVYAIMPSHKVYLLPTFLLKKAWLSNRHTWSAEYGEIPSHNKTYTTINVPVPVDILLGAIIKEMEEQLVTGGVS